MLNTLVGYLKTPAFDDIDKQREFTTLNTILLTLLFAAIPALFVTAVQFSPIEFFNVTVATGIALTSLILIRHGKYTFPRYAIPGWLMMLITFSVAEGSGLHDIALSGYWMVVALASLLIGRPAPLVFSGLAIMMITGIYAGEKAGYIQDGRGSTDIFDVIVLSIFFSISGVLLEVLMRNLEQTARHARETEEARRLAEEANEVKSQFLANMSHELRTPLNAILNFTGFVAKGVMGPVNEEQVETLNEAIDSGKHLLSLINDILDLTKIEAGLMDIFVEQVNMNEIVETSASIAKGLVKDRPIELDIDIQANLPSTYGDKRRLRQVMLNIVSNAVKFTPKGKVSIKANFANDKLSITIADTGIGIAPEDQYLVFESFKQAKHELPDAFGTGLGMPISKYFVEIHGGNMWFESARGVGTTFFVEIPILTEVEAQSINQRLTAQEQA